MTETLGIISSFDILCGNATYSEQLAQAAEKRGMDVKRIAVPNIIQKEDDPKLIDEIIKQVRQCSIINLQMELGLYGSNPVKSSKNLRKIIKNCPPKTTIEVHRVEKKPVDFLRNVKNNLTFGFFFKALYLSTKSWARQSYVYNAYKSIYENTEQDTFKIISHTYRDKKYLKKYFEVDSVLHPIMWPDTLIADKPEVRNKTGFSVGIFGFISPHKNFPLVIEAFHHLLESNKIPHDSQLVICGGHHPEAPGYGWGYDINASFQKEYIPSMPTSQLSSLIAFYNLENVDWYIGLPDDELAHKISDVDVVVIPYIETGQSGSGITSQALQFAQHTVMSDTKMASQHQDLCDNRIKIFDASSPISCAHAILQAYHETDIPRFKKEFSYERLIDIITFTNGNTTDHQGEES